jgi:hypothetical protein
MIDVDHTAGEEKRVDERHHSAVRGLDRCADRPGEIHTKVSARQSAVESATGTELTRDA